MIIYHVVRVVSEDPTITLSVNWFPADYPLSGSIAPRSTKIITK